MTPLQKINEAIDIVARMNMAIVDGCAQPNCIELSTDGEDFEIRYQGNTIFTSTDDYTDDDQTLEDYLWEAIKDMMEDFAQMFELAKSKTNGE